MLISATPPPAASELAGIGVPNMNDTAGRSAKARVGIPGLDDILLGGFRRNRLFLIEGRPGTGKTTLALQFLLEGARNHGEGTLHHSFRN